MNAPQRGGGLVFLLQGRWRLGRQSRIDVSDRSRGFFSTVGCCQSGLTRVDRPAGRLAFVNATVDATPAEFEAQYEGLMPSVAALILGKDIVIPPADCSPQGARQACFLTIQRPTCIPMSTTSDASRAVGASVAHHRCSAPLVNGRRLWHTGTIQ